MSRISGLKNKIKKLENKDSIKYVAAKEREILELKQDLQCLQVKKDNLQFKLDKYINELVNVNEKIIKLQDHIAVEENKKLKNRFKKLLAG